MAEPAPPAPHSASVPRGRATAWVLYDLANTVYAATLTFMFAPWFGARFGSTSLGVTQTASMVFAGLLVPVAGAICDRTLATRGYLALSTLVCIAAMASWGVFDGRAGLLLGLAIANVGYNVALLFYNALLASVAPPARAGLVSGIGTGIGYFGTVLVLVLLPSGDRGGQGRFLAAAGLFLAFALPCLLLVKDRRAPVPASPGVVRKSLGSLWRTLRELPRHRSLGFFLLGNFCLVDVLNTAILFFFKFTVDVFRSLADEGGLQLLGWQPDSVNAFGGLAGLALNLLALAAGVLLGLRTDRSPLGVMRCSALALLLAVVAGAVFGGTSPLAYLLTMVPLGALGLAGIWTAGRKLVLVLAPRERVGEYFGLYGVTVKLSVLGSTVYGVLDDRFGPKPALLAQSAQLLLGLLFLSLVSLPRAGQAGGSR